MRLLNVGYNIIPTSGGVHTAVLSFFTALNRYGHDVRCLSFTDHDLIPSSGAPGFNQVTIPPSRLGRIYGRVDKSQLSGFAREVETADLVFIHLLYRHHAAWSAQTAKRYGKPVIVVPHGGLDPWVFTYRGWSKRLWLRWYRDLLFGSHCTTLFATEAEMIKAGTMVRSASTRVLSWPLEELGHNAQGVSLRKGSGARRKLLFIGRLHPMKRILETIRALRSLNRSDWELTIAGPPSLEISVKTLQQESADLWNDQIRYIGTVERSGLGMVYANADALVLLSHRENFGYVVAEAMCEGLPVAISSDVDLGSIVTKSRSGLVKSIRNDKDIADILRALLDLSSRELADMGIAAAATARHEFRFDRFSDSLNALVTDCVSGHRAATILGK